MKNILHCKVKDLTFFSTRELGECSHFLYWGEKPELSRLTLSKTKDGLQNEFCTRWLWPTRTNKNWLLSSPQPVIGVMGCHCLSCWYSGRDISHNLVKSSSFGGTVQGKRKKERWMDDKFRERSREAAKAQTCESTVCQFELPLNRDGAEKWACRTLHLVGCGCVQWLLGLGKVEMKGVLFVTGITSYIPQYIKEWKERHFAAQNALYHKKQIITGFGWVPFLLIMSVYSLTAPPPSLSQRDLFSTVTQGNSQPHCHNSSSSFCDSPQWIYLYFNHNVHIPMFYPD